MGLNESVIKNNSLRGPKAGEICIGMAALARGIHDQDFFCGNTCPLCQGFDRLLQFNLLLGQWREGVEQGGDPHRQDKGVADP